MKRVLSTMHMVMPRSRKGSITINFTQSFSWSHQGQQSQIRYFLANVYQQGWHFCLDSSSSAERHQGQHHSFKCQTMLAFSLNAQTHSFSKFIWNPMCNLTVLARPVLFSSYYFYSLFLYQVKWHWFNFHDHSDKSVYSEDTYFPIQFLWVLVGLTIHCITEETDGAQPSFPLHWRRLSRWWRSLEDRSGNCVFCIGGFLEDRKQPKISKMVPVKVS